MWVKPHCLGETVKKFSPRTVAAFTNLVLVLLLAAVGCICFFPAAARVSSRDERVVRSGTSEDGVSLMFNVYWGEKEVDEILSVLARHGAKATFFLGGSWADDNAACVRRIAAAGHEIGSHGYFHRDHTTLGYEGNVQEIGQSVRLLNLLAERPVTLFAPPSGAFDADTVNAAEALGLRTVLWSKDTIDWRDKEERTCFLRATEGVTGGDLILMHPMPHTAAALSGILDCYAERGLRAVTVSEHLGIAV